MFSRISLLPYPFKWMPRIHCKIPGQIGNTDQKRSVVRIVLIATNDLRNDVLTAGLDFNPMLMLVAVCTITSSNMLETIYIMRWKFYQFRFVYQFWCSTWACYLDSVNFNLHILIPFVPAIDNTYPKRGTPLHGH